MSVNNCKSTTSIDLRVDTDFQQGGKYLLSPASPFNKTPNLEVALETPDMTSKGSSGSPLPAKAPRMRKSTIEGSRWQKAAPPA